MTKLLFLTLALSLTVVVGCGSLRNEWMKTRQTITMLDTEINLYNCAGDTIATWHTRANVESNGGEAWWVDDSGTQHHIAGTFAIHAK